MNSKSILFFVRGTVLSSLRLCDCSVPLSCPECAALAFVPPFLATSAWLQVPPIQMDPRVSLEAIFSIMNNMALEIVPIVSTGGVYHGLVTRACMMRFQKKLAKKYNSEQRIG